MTTKQITVTFRDLYVIGSDTITLEGKIADQFDSATDKTVFLRNLETVSFSHPYVVRVVRN